MRLVPTLDGSKARQHEWAGWRAGTTAEEIPPMIMGWRCQHCDFVLKIYKVIIGKKP